MKFTGKLSVVLSRRHKNLRYLSSSFNHRVTVSDIGDGIKNVELNRPDKMNALDGDMFKAICYTASELRKDKSVRVVIISGKGKAFCTGLDIKSVNLDSRKLLDRPAGTELSNMAQDVSYLWRQLEVPVIAATHGMCFGGGLQIALGADFRITTPDCKFSIMEAKWVCMWLLNYKLGIPDIFLRTHDFNIGAYS